MANLAPSVTEYDLLVLFQPHGKLTRLDIVFHGKHAAPHERGKPKGYAFVEFAQPEQAARARYSVEGKLVKGREVRIRYATANDAQEGNVASGRSNLGPRGDLKSAAAGHRLQSARSGSSKAKTKEADK